MQHYEADSPKAAVDFVLDVEETAALLVEFPRIGTPSPKGTRKIRLGRFPYSLVYRVGSDDVIRVFALQHHRRNPESWRDRVREVAAVPYSVDLPQPRSTPR